MFLIRALPVTQTMRFEAVAQQSLP